MRIELVSTGPDGGPNWIEVRENIKGGDIFAVNEAAEVPLNEDGRAARMSFKKLDDDQFIALCQRLVTGWSFQVPLPRTAEQMRSVLSDLEAPDLRKLRTEMQPLLDLVKGDGDSPDPKSGDVPAGAVPDRQAPPAE